MFMLAIPRVEEGPHDEISLQSTGASDTSSSRLDRAALVE